MESQGNIAAGYFVVIFRNNRVKEKLGPVSYNGRKVFSNISVKHNNKSRQDLVIMAPFR